MKNLTIVITESYIDASKTVWITSSEMKCHFPINRKDIAKEIMSLQNKWKELCEMESEIVY